ncbi:Translin, partial [Pseudolycoriella hygida]
MQNSDIQDVFSKFQEHINREQEVREQIRDIVKLIDSSAKQAATTLQIIHSDLSKITEKCIQARKCFEECKEQYTKLGNLIPTEQYYRYSEWHYLTQTIVFLIALTVYLESGTLVTRESVA